MQRTRQSAGLQQEEGCPPLSAVLGGPLILVVGSPPRTKALTYTFIWDLMCMGLFGWSVNHEQTYECST